MAECTFQCGIQMNDIGSDHRCGNPYNDQIIPQFFVFEHRFEIPHQKQVKHIEVDTEQQHENGNHIFKIWTVISSDTAVFDGETTSTRCGEGMVDAVKERHTACKQQNHFQYGQYDVNAIQNFCCGFDLWHQLADNWSRGFCLHQVHGTVIPQRYNGKDEYQNPHTADPVGKAAPEQYAHGQTFDFRKNRCPCCGKTGYGFKKTIDNAINGTTQIKRHCTENGHHNPGKSNNDKAFSAINSFILRCEMLHGCPDDQKQYDGNQKSP